MPVIGGTRPVNLWVGTLALGIVAACVFLTYPQIDLSVSRTFYDGNGKFSGQSLGWIRASRNFFLIVFYLCIAMAVAGLIMTRSRTRSWLRLSNAQWLFLGICLAMGPGVVANLVLKDHWGRARPRQVIEFGGAKTFTPPLIPSDQCTTNCAFVSGEAASIFIPFYALALVMPQWAGALVIAGTLSGLAAGFVRIAQGGHFLSDVVFAGVFMALTALAVHRAMFGRVPIAGPDRSTVAKTP